ncbi:MAG: chaperone modulator CbpM [Bacteroidia bacterium]
MEQQKNLMTIAEIAEFCGLERETVEELLEQDIIACAERHPEPKFSEEQVVLVRRVRRLNQDIGVNLPGIDVIFHMRERMLEMQQQMKEMETQMERMRRKHHETLRSALVQGGMFHDLD